MYGLGGPFFTRPSMVLEFCKKIGALALVKLQFLYMPILACPWSLAPGAGLFLEGINVLILPVCYCKQSGSP